MQSSPTINNGVLDEVVTFLDSFGVEKTDAILYLTLFQSHPSTANILASKLDIDRGKVYRSLRKLQNLGLVSSTFSNPTMCSPIDPQDALSSIIQRKEDEIIVLRKLLNKTIENLDKLKSPVQEMSQVPSFYVIQGRPNIYGHISKLIQQSSRTLYIITTIEDVLRMYHTAIPEKIAESTRKGLHVKLITETEDIELLGKIAALNSSEVRIGKLPSKSRTLISDEKILIMSGRVSKTMNLSDDIDSILYTNSEELAANMNSFCNNLWNISKPVKIIHGRMQ